MSGAADGFAADAFAADAIAEAVTTAYASASWAEGRKVLTDSCPGARRHIDSKKALGEIAMKSGTICVLVFVLLSACNPPDCEKGGRDGSGGTAPARKRVFITSGTYTGNIKQAGGGADGLDGGDKLCTTVARGAGLSGTFKAWLSSDSVDAKDRITDVGPWFQVPADGEPIKTFNNVANLSGA